MHRVKTVERLRVHRYFTEPIGGAVLSVRKVQEEAGKEGQPIFGLADMIEEVKKKSRIWIVSERRMEKAVSGAGARIETVIQRKMQTMPRVGVWVQVQIRGETKENGGEYQGQLLQAQQGQAGGQRGAGRKVRPVIVVILVVDEAKRGLCSMTYDGILGEGVEDEGMERDGVPWEVGVRIRSVDSEATISIERGKLMDRIYFSNTGVRAREIQVAKDVGWTEEEIRGIVQAALDPESAGILISRREIARMRRETEMEMSGLDERENGEEVKYVVAVDTRKAGSFEEVTMRARCELRVTGYEGEEEGERRIYGGF